MAATVLPVPASFAVGSAQKVRTARHFSVGADSAMATALDEAFAGAAALAHAAFGETLTRADGESGDIVVRFEEAKSKAEGRDPRHPDRLGASESYRISSADGVLTLWASSAEAVFRALTTIVAAHADSQEHLLALTVTDAPRFAWRGLSLDVVRSWVPADQVKQIIDLLALMKLNVLHIHFTDMQAWRLPVGFYPDVTSSEHYSQAELDELEAYARARFVTIVPEVDVPGHVAAAVQAVPELAHTEYAHPMLAHLSWDNPAVRPFIEKTLGVLTSTFASPHIHIGGDEAFGMPHEDYVTFVAAYVALVRDSGRKPIGWQESLRAGALGAGDIAQLWVAERDRFDPEKARQEWPESYHPFIEIAAPLFALAVGDPDIAAENGVELLVSSSDPIYLDRRPSEPSLDPAQNELFTRLGHAGYEATPSDDVLRWEPTEQADIVAAGAVVSGIEAAVWCESVTSFDDLTALLLPRLGLIAERAWGEQGSAAEPALKAAAAQARAWERLGFTAYYRSERVFSAS